MKNRNKYIILFLLIFLMGCEQELNWQFNETQNIVVVDALITNEIKAHEIYVHEFDGNLNANPVPISDIEIKLISRLDTIYYRESATDKGTYIAEKEFRAGGSILYKLVINHLGFSDTATARLTAIDPLENISISSNGELHKFDYMESNLASMMDVFYDWSSNRTYCEQMNKCETWETYYTLRNLDIQKEFAPEKEEILFPAGTRIIRHKYSLSLAHQKFIRSLLIETEWRGGLYDPEQGNVQSNFRHGIKGWFGVCMVLKDTTYINE